MADSQRQTDAASAYRRARQLREAGQSREAADALRALAEKEPCHARLHYELGACLEDVNDKQAAQAEFRRAIEIDPGYAAAWFGIARVARAPFSDADIEQILAVQENDAASIEARMLTGFALGRHYEQSGEHANAAEQYLFANRTTRSAFNYDFAADKKMFEDLKTIFDADFMQKWSDAGIGDRTPIFIVGMPRSGTTLVEQILSSHAEVAAGGELPLLIQSILSSFPGVAGHDYLPALANAEAGCFRRAAETYISHLPAHDTMHLTDKLPHNFLNVGIIRILFPGARIVHCRRDARDTCFSIYKNLFGTHPYTFDLEELGRYYNEYRALMAHWDEILPGAIHSVDYETMIADQEATTRGLLEACGLDWDPNCLEFFRHDRSIPTISATQVQQPIYGSSVAAWENYADMLEPLLAVLDD